MTREEFEDEVERRVGTDLRGSDYLKAAIYDFARQGEPFYAGDVVAALQEAEKRRVQADAPPKKAKPRRSPRPKPGAEALFISKMLVEDLRPWIEALRERGFGGPYPPYPADENAAADYIEKVSAADRVRWVEERGGSEGDHERISRLAHQLGLDVTTRARFLPYGRPGENHRRNAPVFPDTFLFELAGEVNSLSERTGLPPDALTGHVLTGATPLVPRVRIASHENHVRLPSGKQAHLRAATLTIRTADLTFEELRMIYGEIKDYMGGKGVQALAVEDLEFWELVEEMGGPPEPYNGVREFWRQVRTTLNRRRPDAPPLKSWEGLRKKYERICERLGA